MATASVVSRVRLPLNGVAPVLVQPVSCNYNALGFMPLEASYAVTSFPPYHQPQLPRLSLSYDLVTPLPPMPLPPMAVPLDGQYSTPMRSVALPSFTNSWPAPRPLYIQVPASPIKSEGNGHSATEELLPTTDMEEKLHSAEAPPGPTSTPLPDHSLSPFTLNSLTTEEERPTTTIPPEEGDNDPAPIPIPSLSKPINNEPELGFSFTPSLEDVETTRYLRFTGISVVLLSSSPFFSA
ncbi:hypothetical protein ANCCAN_03312 [Ancylostoma caninum]|uniref:Uncharacterized protein n=1 Tax=Ancylostoma caninum TaxID=29170 RepID=A0A368H4Y3_ANCCA|nr:hypothetical protein ANCCAN_03312 [Ancylostoma caninum]